MGASINDDGINKTRDNFQESGAVYYVRDTELDNIKSKKELKEDIHAYLQYNAIKNINRNKEVKDVYENISKIPEMEDFSKEDVEIVYKHVLIISINLKMVIKILTQAMIWHSHSKG